jgi:uncharacterized membrane protein (DUF2068 family)
MDRAKSRQVRPVPSAIDESSFAAGLRAIATLEALKGVLVLLAGFGLLHFLHRDVGEAAEHVVQRLHMNPSRHFGQVFIAAASKLTDAKLWALAAAALAYSIVRFVEAYGLWNRRVWAQWFALLSGMIYIPWELYEVLDRPTKFRLGILAINIVIVVYMAWIRFADWRRSRALPS